MAWKQTSDVVLPTSEDAERGSAHWDAKMAEYRHKCLHADNMRAKRRYTKLINFAEQASFMARKIDR